VARLRADQSRSGFASSLERQPANAATAKTTTPMPMNIATKRTSLWSVGTSGGTAAAGRLDWLAGSSTEILSAGVGDGSTGEDESGTNPPGNPPNPAGRSLGSDGPAAWSLLGGGWVPGGIDELEVAGGDGDGVGGSVGDGESVGVSEGLGVSDGIGGIGDSVALGGIVGGVGVGTGVGKGCCAHAGPARNTSATNTPMLAAHLITPPSTH
jgi:hypothetical protein